jgi:hypothetical protein
MLAPVSPLPPVCPGCTPLPEPSPVDGSIIFQKFNLMEFRCRFQMEIGWLSNAGSAVTQVMRVYSVYYRRFIAIYYYLNCYMFWSYDYLQVEIYKLGFTQSSWALGSLYVISYELYDWWSVSQYVLVLSTLVGLATRYYFLSECCCLKFVVLYLWGALSDERTGLSMSKLLYDWLSVSMSWYRAPLWDLRPDITSCRNVAVWNLRSLGRPSDERSRLQFAVSGSYFTTDTVSQSVRPGIEYPCGTRDQILLSVEMLLSEICGLVSMGRPLWREDGSAICSLITWLFESRRTRNHTLLSHLRLPQPGGPGSHIYIPQEQGGPVIPQGTGFPLPRLLRLRGLQWRYSNPPPTWKDRSVYI